MDFKIRLLTILSFKTQIFFLRPLRYAIKGNIKGIFDFFNLPDSDSARHKSTFAKKNSLAA
jgi:hypothetical protein